VNIAVNTVAAIIPPITITPIDQSFNIDLSASSLGLATDDTLFGTGAIIYNASDFGIYCVDCGFTGTILVVGSLTYSVAQGVSYFYLTGYPGADRKLF
jgi:hypothetical protein